MIAILTNWIIWCSTSCTMSWIKVGSLSCHLVRKDIWLAPLCCLSLLTLIGVMLLLLAGYPYHEFWLTLVAILILGCLDFGRSFFLITDRYFSRQMMWGGVGLALNHCLLFFSSWDKSSQEHPQQLEVFWANSQPSYCQREWELYLLFLRVAKVTCSCTKVKMSGHSFKCALSVSSIFILLSVELGAFL